MTLDADLGVISRYVELSTANYDTFSIEFVRLILAACSEVDVIAKLLCDTIDPSMKAKNINDYRTIIRSKYPHFHRTEITVPRYDLTLYPWGEWIGDGNPEWWAAYNKIKHDRSGNFDKANLNHALGAVAGLFVLVLYYYQRGLGREELDPLPRVLSMAVASVPLYEGSYVLPDPEPPASE